MRLSGVVFLGAAATLTGAERHNHAHRHAARHSSPVERRSVATTTTVEGAVVTVYELNGHVISSVDVDSCLKESRCVIVGDKINSGASSATILTPSSTSVSAAVFVEVPTSSVASYPPTSTYSMQHFTSNPSSSASAPSSSPTSVSASGSGEGVDNDFPSGELDCSKFPSGYGAVAADWLGLNGWTGVQKTPEFTLSAKVISYIETATSGSGCTPNSFCSYNCPAGYQKSQWPLAQGNTGQSIGGLYCNTFGKLELSRPRVQQLCTPGVGQIRATNKLPKNVAVCRTDYPGTESETVALDVKPGSTLPVTCPSSRSYYRTWLNAPTSAQYYVNPSGYGVHEACTWGNPGSNLGNWAPVNLGVGQGDSGSIFVSIFPNAPSNPDGVLDFGIKITGDVSGDCSYVNGKYYKDGVESPTGCTVSVNGPAYFEFH